MEAHQHNLSPVVLLLKTEPHKLGDIEPFLRHRGYIVHEVFALREAIQFITTKRPNCALLPTCLIPEQANWLVNILIQLTDVILYAEKISAKALSVSREYKDTQFLQPPLTAVGVEQTLRRTMRDHRKFLEEASQLGKVHVSIMSTLSDLALRAVCSPNDRPGNPVVQLVGEQVTRVTCLRVETSYLSGYFILAYGRNKTPAPEWTEKLQAELRNYLSNFDSSPTIETAEDLTIEEIPFSKWTREHAEFVKSVTHENSELVLAFFKDSGAPRVQPSLKKDHVELDIALLADDEKLDFDVYIYLPQNARFVLYTPKGGTLYQSQKKKLMSDGIQSVHIHKRSLDELRRHRAYRFVDDSVSAVR